MLKAVTQVRFATWTMDIHEAGTQLKMDVHTGSDPSEICSSKMDMRKAGTQLRNAVALKQSTMGVRRSDRPTRTIRKRGVHQRQKCIKPVEPCHTFHAAVTYPDGRGVGNHLTFWPVLVHFAEPALQR